MQSYHERLINDWDDVDEASKLMGCLAGTAYGDLSQASISPPYRQRTGHDDRGYYWLFDDCTFVLSLITAPVTYRLCSTSPSGRIEKGVCCQFTGQRSWEAFINP